MDNTLVVQSCSSHARLERVAEWPLEGECLAFILSFGINRTALPVRNDLVNTLDVGQVAADVVHVQCVHGEGCTVLVEDGIYECQVDLHRSSLFLSSHSHSIIQSITQTTKPTTTNKLNQSI
jgi:hypothetical protein